MESPRVSVLVTTFNHSSFVETALDSLVQQSFQEFEVVITDDASTDNTADIIHAWLARHPNFRAKFRVNEANQGICRNRNDALARSSGEFVCSLSGDDAYEPCCIERQLKFMESQPEDVAVVYGDACMIDAAGDITGASFLAHSLSGERPPEGRILRRLLAGNYLCAPAAMIRRSCLEAVGGYDESLHFEDYDMWLRLASRFDFRVQDITLVRYRVLETSMSHAKVHRPRMLQSEVRMMLKTYSNLRDPLLKHLALDFAWSRSKQLLRERAFSEARAAMACCAVHVTSQRRKLLAALVFWPLGPQFARFLVRLEVLLDAALKLWKTVLLNRLTWLAQ